MLRPSLNVLAVMTLLVVLATTGEPTVTYGQTGKTSALPSTITFVFPLAAGGGGDVQTRLVARHLPKYLPGNPATVVRNEVGAGGRAGVQYVARSKADGSVIGAAYTPGVLSNQITSGADAGYDYSKFVLLTSTYHQAYTVAAGPKTPYNKLDDLKKAGKAVSFCVTGDIDLAYTVIAAKVVGFPFRLIPGYKGAPLAVAGLLRGDCEAVSFSLEFTNRYLKEGVRPIAVHAEERDKLWPNVPTSKEQGYPLDLKIDVVFFLPQGSPVEIANVLREGLTKLYQDKEFLDEIRAAKFTPTFADTKRTQQMGAGLFELFSKYAPDIREAAAKVQ